MRYLPDWIAQQILCIALALSVSATVCAAADNLHGATYEQRVAQYKARNAAQMDSPLSQRTLFVAATPAKISAAAVGPEHAYRTSVDRHVVSSHDLQCLTEALYFEARGETRTGQRAVAEVILNRVDSRRFPNSVCGVINQRNQFSYTIGGKKKILDKSAYLQVRSIAAEALTGTPRNLTGGATYFHTLHVHPTWARRFIRTTQIGGHIFYRQGRKLASN